MTASRQLVRVHNLGVSVDGFATGDGQAMDAPFGHAGFRLVDWFLDTAMGHELQGRGLEGAGRGIDNAMTESGFRGIGAEIMGRNKFGPQRGSWEDEDGLEGLEERFDVETVASPKGIVHLTFTRRTS